MTVKQHYDNHLGHFYAWMIGDIQPKKNEFLNFCLRHDIVANGSGTAIDLGAGHGIQSLALSEAGFEVLAIDFNQTLLEELNQIKGDRNISTINEDMRNIANYKHINPDLVVCGGDTIAHLDSKEELSKFIADIGDVLNSKGKFIMSFRDYSQALTDTDRFIPVKSDSDRILTCYLEYFEKRIRVTDLLYQRIDGYWVQQVSSYFKIRISLQIVLNLLVYNSFEVQVQEKMNGMNIIVAQRQSL
ncbi:MAG: class I SAM-dependent methyltransferase [Candidatus Cyclobacteriaceae bacterium M3_2C_046]